MIDLWFGEGAFASMPDSLTSYLISDTASNIRDVRATFRESYSVDAFRKLAMPVLTVVGERSPDITHRIARAISDFAPHGALETMADATHALTATHVEAVADAISRAAR